MARFGYNLRRARERAELSQDQLGALAQISQGSISRLEAGDREPGLFAVIRLTEALDVEPTDLIDGLWHKNESK